MEQISFSQNWQELLAFLPAGWQSQAKQLGALRRCRKFASPEELLRTLLIHLAEGCSLRTTAVKARLGAIAAVSDVTIMNRLKASSEWLRWLAVNLKQEWINQRSTIVEEKKLSLKIVDATTICEPGATGTTWRIHYAISLPSLRCEEVQLTSPKTGESFLRFSVSPGDIFLADRGYCQGPGIAYVVKNGGHVLLRIKYSLALYEAPEKRWDVFTHLRQLKVGEVGDWPVQLETAAGLIPGRVCAMKKSEAAAAKARKEIAKEAKRKGKTVQPKTWEAAGYIMVFTTINNLAAADVLEIYRLRWQIELVFKRLKSLMGLGHLRKTDVEGARAWLHGKLLVAFMLEAMLRAGETFSPWGYPLRTESEHLAGDGVYVAVA